MMLRSSRCFYQPHQPSCCVLSIVYLCFHYNGSVYAGGVGCIGVVLAALQGEAGFHDDWFLQAEYCVLIPSLIFAVAMLAEFWVEGLPSQVRQRCGPV